MFVSVIIPSFNGGRKFPQVLKTVLAQQVPWSFEVIIVDSESSDGTAQMLAEKARTDSRLKVFSIPQAEFGHGKTRNYAIGLCRGDFAVLITQDAEPLNTDWLRFLVESVAAVPDSAGGFGRHAPFPETNPFVARDLNNHFDALARMPAERYIRDRAEYDRDVGLRQTLHFHSDNNACIRKAYWQQHPLPEIPFGEDQAWARGVMERGDKLVYVDGAVVRHAHNFGPLENYKRAKEEAVYYAREFGYVLEKRPLRALRRSFRQTFRDVKYFLGLPKPRPSWKWICLVGPLNLARRLGYWRGAKIAFLSNCSEVSGKKGT